jgi:hypothetical protein
MRARLKEGGAHVVPYGYYHAAHVVASQLGSDAAYERFTSDQAPGFGAPARPAASAPEAAAGVKTGAEPDAQVA